MFCQNTNARVLPFSFTNILAGTSYLKLWNTTTPHTFRIFVAVFFNRPVSQQIKDVFLKIDSNNLF